MADMYIVPAIGSVAVFGWLAVHEWTESRRKEREAFYRSETLRHYTESNQPDMLARFLAEEKAARHEMRVQQRESLRLGGLVTMMAGIGLGVMLEGIEPQERLYLVGLVPFLIGLAILIYVYLLSPKLPQAVDAAQRREP
ncbi:MAG: hypothetical protein ACE141_16195 [Bryobacteraceae bacterium]